MYADDTVLYTQGKDLNMIKNALSRDMSSLAAWFHENELIINLKMENRGYAIRNCKEVSNNSKELGS